MTIMRKNRRFSVSKIYYQGPITDHFDGKRFYNPWAPKLPNASDLMRWRLSNKPKPWPARGHIHHFDTPPDRVEGHELRVSFVGHSTMLIQTDGLNILTDPIWAKRASPFKWIGPKRYANPGISLDHLPKIDIILISHNHYDHMDLHTIKKLWIRDKPRIITPLGNDTIIQANHNAIEVETLDWQQSIFINDTMRIHLQPAQHWSARGILDRNKALWGAFVIEAKGGNIYFAGDSGYGKGDIFRDTLKRFGSFRFAMIPIGAYEPQWFMSYAHMNPEEAVLVHKDLDRPYTAAIHFHTFKLGSEGRDEPMTVLNESLKKFNLDENRFRSLKIGEHWMIPEK